MRKSGRVESEDGSSMIVRWHEGFSLMVSGDVGR